ncbi:L,D-transpeptidase family protein [Faunimonas sp. B44]|uniref:L,D-transpeptidase family protein n=1 Tax=Faunimonas sp. B44 TaxID=3461493 RepID=UPI0040441D5B
MRQSALLAASAALLALTSAGFAKPTDVALAVPNAPAEAPVLDGTAMSEQAELVWSLLEGRTEPRDRIEREILANVRAFYKARRFEPAWIVDRKATRNAKALVARMSRAAEDGLDPSAYATPPVHFFALKDPQVAAQADIAITLAAARFVAHLAAGQLVPSSLGEGLSQKPERPDLAAALARLVAADDAALAVEALEPPHPEYRALKAELARLRAAPAEAETVEIPPGPALKLGGRGERVALLRARLALPGAQPSDEAVFDDALLAAVKTFQARHGLNADGVVGAATLARLNSVSRDAEIGALIVNMERWRWMPRDLGSFHVFVNVPEFVARVRKDGETAFRTRVVVGTPTNQTPLFSNAIDHLVVNPYWNVPTSILSKEMLPDIQADPGGYFSRRGYQVLARAGGQMRVVRPDTIDWTAIDVRSLRVRQPPGEANALGRIKFMFPNEHAVYLHDTPLKKLFERDARAFSHGCVRVDNPLAFADAVLVDEAEWNSDRLQKLYGGPERRINLSRSIPVHLAYFTMAVDGEGVLHRYSDLYGIDARMQKALGNSTEW